jgi:hypothetical protein
MFDKVGEMQIKSNVVFFKAQAAHNGFKAGPVVSMELKGPTHLQGRDQVLHLRVSS